MTSPAVSRVRPVLEGNAWFARQSAVLRAGLLGAGRLERLAKGAWAYGEGDEAAGLCAVIDGALRLEAAVDDGRTVLINILPAGAVVGQSARFGGGPRLVTARAARPAEVFLVSDRALRRLSETEPGTWRAVAELVYEQLAATMRMTVEAVALPPRRRILARLEAIAPNGRAPGGRVVGVGQAELAEMTGLSRKSVNRHLARMQAEGLVRLGYGWIEIRRPAATV